MSERLERHEDLGNERDLRGFQSTKVADLRGAVTPIDDHEVHATRQSSNSVIRLKLRAKSGKRTVETADLGTVDALLRPTKGHGPEAAHLDHDERYRRPRIDGQDVYLITVNLHVASHNAPAESLQVGRRLCLRRCASSLPFRRHLWRP